MSDIEDEHVIGELRDEWQKYYNPQAENTIKHKFQSGNKWEYPATIRQGLSTLQRLSCISVFLCFGLGFFLPTRWLLAARKAEGGERETHAAEIVQTEKESCKRAGGSTSCARAVGTTQVDQGRNKRQGDA